MIVTKYIMISHFIYKTTSLSGKFYIGRHSTSNIDDGYLGSGSWVRSIKDRKSLTREILEMAETPDHLKALETRYIEENIGKPNCMNWNTNAVGFSFGEFNPSNTNKAALVARRRARDNSEMPRGDAHYMRNSKEHRQAASLKMQENNPAKNPEIMTKIAVKTAARMRTNNPMFIPEVRQKIAETGLFTTNNPSRIAYSCLHCQKTGLGGRFKSHHLTQQKCKEVK